MKRIFLILFFTLILLEVLIRLSGAFKTYSESISGEYLSHYQNANKKTLTWTPNSQVKFKQKEFTYINDINEWGHREKSINFFIQDSLSFKILCLGDSFTEGDGAPYDSSWVRRFEQRLNENFDTNILCYNAGVCGSDVIFNHQILKNKLIDLKPDIIIETINTSDIDDLVFLGGLNRNIEKNMDGPQWEVFFKYSHTIRAILNVFKGYDEKLMSEEDYLEERKKAKVEIVKQVNKTAAFCNQENIPYFLIVHPLPSEIILIDKFFEYHNLFDDNSFTLYLNEDFRKYFLHRSLDNYYWKINGHFNSKGYSLMGDVIYEKIKKYICIK